MSLAVSPARACRIASLGIGLSALALVCLLPSEREQARVGAQSGSIHFSLEETWRDRRPDYPVRALDWPAGHEAGGLDVAADGSRVVAVDRTAGQLRVYDAEGSFVEAFGSVGSAAGQLDRPSDVAILADGRLAVSDGGNDRLQIWSAQGGFERAWPVDDPHGIAFVDHPDSAGIYVVARAVDGRSRVEGYAADGLPTERFDVAYMTESDPPRQLRPAIEGLAYVKTESINDGGTLRPVAGFLLSAPADGRALMLQGPNVMPRLVILDRSDPPRLSLPGLKAVASWQDPLSGSRHSFAAAPDAGILPLAGVLPEQADRIPLPGLVDLALSAEGRLFASGEAGLFEIGDAGWLWPRLLGLGRLVGPRRLAAGEALLVADAWPRVQRWSLAGAPEASMQVAVPGGGTVTALDVAQAGSQAWVLSADAILRRVDGDRLGGFWQASTRPWSSPVALATGETGPALLDLSRQQVLWLDEALTPIDRLDLASPEATFRNLVDLAVDGDRVFVADAENAQVEVHDREAGTVLPIAVPGGVVRVAEGPGASLIALSPTGWAYAFDPDGRPRGQWPMDESGIPEDIALGDDGRLYAAGPGDVLRAYARDDSAGPGSPPAVEPGCRLVGDKRASPARIPLGETVTVTLEIGGACRSSDRSADVLLLVDTSGSMAEGRKYVVAKNAAIGFVAGMGRSDTRVAVMGFHSFPELKLALSRDRAAAATAVGEMVIGGGTNIVGALDAAVDHLSGAPAENGRTDVARVVVMLSDGRSGDNNLDAVLAEARSAGVEIYTIGLGDDVEPAMLARIASDPGKAYLSPGIDTLMALYAEIGRRILEPPLFEDQLLVDRLPANMRYVAGSAEPKAPDVAPDGSSLSWPRARLAAEGWALSYRLEPLEAGLWPTNEAAWLDYSDGLGEPGRYDFPVPEVRVIASSRAIYLPLSLRETCPPRFAEHEIVLVIDSSGSMLEPAGGGGDKLSVALASAREFLALTELGRDRIAVVSFDSRARLASGLSDDRGLLDSALAGIESHPGTRIGTGLAAALLALESARPESQQLILLLTDGRDEDPEMRDARARAAEAELLGVRRMVIGLGSRVDASALRAIASDPALYFEAPSADDLRGIYRGIAVALPCPPEALWGRR